MNELLQAVVNGVMAGSLLAIPAIGFTTIFAVLRYPSFAIAAYATIGAFAGWCVSIYVVNSIPIALLAAGGAAALSGLLGEQVLLKPLRPSGALTIAIGSVAVNLLFENIVRFAFGNDLRSYDLPIVRDWVFSGIRIGPQQTTNGLFAGILMAAVFAFLHLTRFGRAMRAVADNPDLARLKGIDPQVIAGVTIAVSVGLVGMGGVLIGLDTSIDPLTGSRILLSVFAAAVLGGLGSIPGAVVGALVLGIGEELALMVVPSIYRSAVGFAAILLILTFRPRGLMGERAV